MAKPTQREIEDFTDMAKAREDAGSGRYQPPVKYGPLQGFGATHRELERNTRYQKTWRRSKK